MAGFGTGIPGSEGGSSGSGSASVGGSQVISPLALPELMQLFNRTQANIPNQDQLGSLQGMIQGGINSPLLQMVLGPALQRLQPQQAQQRQNLTESTRAAGGLRGSTYGQDMNTLQNNQALQTNDLMAQVIQQMLSPLISGQLQEQQNQFLPAKSLTDLLQASRPAIAGRGGASASTGWENIPASQGLGTPMMGDTMGPAGGGSDIANMLRQLSTGGSATAPGASATGPMKPANPYTPYLDPLGGGGGGGSYDLGFGAGTQYLNSPATQLPGANGGPVYGEWGVPQTAQVSEGWW